MENLINTDIFSDDLKRALSMALPQPEGLEMVIIPKKLDTSIINAKTPIPSSGHKTVIPTWKVIGNTVIAGFAAFVFIKLYNNPKQKELKEENPAAKDPAAAPEIIESNNSLENLIYPANNN